MLSVVEGENGVGAERGLEHAGIRLPSVKHPGIASEHLLDDPRVGDVDDPAEVGERDTEHVAVASLRADEEADRITRVAEPAEERRPSRTGRQSRPGARGLGTVAIHALTLNASLEASPGGVATLRSRAQPATYLPWHRGRSRGSAGGLRVQRWDHHAFEGR